MAAGNVEQERVQEVEALRLVDNLHCEAETNKLLALASIVFSTTYHQVLINMT